MVNPPDDTVTFAPMTDVVPEDETVTFDDALKQNVNEEVATTRAAKAHYGMGDGAPSVETLRTNIFNGEEGNMRRQMAAQEDIAFRASKLDLINEMTKGRETPLSVGEMSDILLLSQNDIQTDPDTILEKKFSQAYIRDFTNKAEFKEAPPETLAEEQDIGSQVLMRKEYAQTLLEDLNQQKQNMGWAETIGMYGETMIPFKSWANTSNAIKDQKFGGFLPGSNLREQVEYLYLLPEKEFKEQFRAAVNDIASSNVLDAETFAQAVISFSTSDEYLSNLFGVADIVDVATIGGVGMLAKGARKGADAVSSIAGSLTKGQTRKAVKDAVKGMEGLVPEPNKILTHQGNIPEAANYKATQTIQDLWSQADPNKRTLQLKTKVASIFDPDTIGDRIGTFSREAADRIVLHATDTSSAIKQAITNPTIGRLSEEALQAGLKGARAVAREEFKHLNDTILDIDYVSKQPSLAGSYEVSIKLAKPDQNLFTSEAQAGYFAREEYKLLDGDYRIEQQGAGFYLDVTRSLDETQDAVRDVMVSTGNTVPSGMATTLLGFLRSADDLVDPFTRGQRKAAQSLSNEMHRYGKAVGESIGALGRKQRNRLSRLWDADKVYVNPDDGQIGRFANNLESFESNYRTVNGVAPTEAEAKAYFDYVALNDMDWTIRNFGVYRDKARQGVKEFTYSYKVTNPETGQTASVPIRNFEGKEIVKLPQYDEDPFTVLIYDEAANEHQMYKSTTMTDEDKLLVQSYMNDHGYKPIEVYQALMQRPFSKVTGVDDPVNFLLVKSFQEQRLPWDQLPYKPGGHRVWESKHFVKQPRIDEGMDGAKMYVGDRVVFGFETSAEAAKYSARMEEARQLLVANQGGLGKYLARNLPFDEAQFRSLFEETVNPVTGEVTKPQYSKTERFVNVGSGRKTIQDYRDIKFDQNATESPYGNYELLDKEFTTSRDPDLWTVREGGDEANPTYRLDTAKMLDPLPTLNRSMRNIMSDRAMNDYRITAIEKFSSEFEDVLTVSKDEFLKNPMEYLNNLPLDSKNTNKEKLAAARNAAKAALNFIGTETSLGRNVRWLQDKTANMVYKNLGQNASDFVSESMLGTVTDPTRFMRSVAFHTKLGFFSPVQMFVQGQGLTHVLAVSGPKHAFPAYGTAFYFRRMDLNANRNVVEAMAENASRLTRQSKEDILESWDELKKTGYSNVEGEVAFKNDVTDPKVYEGTVGKWLDKGTVFFKETERMIRLSGWHAAYREFKEANPGKVIGNLERQRILDRADLLSLNMTRASNASWQQGIFSVPTQFFAFQARLMEQFLGKRLTTREKTQAFLTYSTLYGIPTGVGATTGVWPWYQEVREQMIAHGVPMDNGMLDAWHEGLVSTLITAATGESYNYSQRLGPGGLDIFREIINGDKDLSDFVFGASGSITSDIIKSIYPVLANTYDVVRGTGEYKDLLVDDALDAARNISTVDNATKIVMAWNFGKYISKNNTYIAPSTTYDAIVSGITGLTPIEVSDAFVKGDIMKKEADAKKVLGKEIVKDLQKGFQAGKDRDWHQMEVYNRRAAWKTQMGGFTPTEARDLTHDAVRGQSVMETIDSKWFRQAPKEAKEAMEKDLMSIGKDK